MILTLLLDEMSFLLKLATGTLPSGFSFHCPGTQGTHSKQNTLLPFVSFPNFVVCHHPFLSHTSASSALLFAHSLHYWGGAVVLQLSVEEGIVGLCLFLLGHAAHQHPICLAGTWNSFPFPPMPAQTSCLRRVPTTLTQRWYQNVVQPCCLEPKSSLF